MVTESGVVTSPCASTPCTISFNPNGGAGTMTPQSVYEDITTVLKANTFTRSGYAFQGWATSAGSSTVAYADKASVTPTGDMTLYAVWKVAQTYTLTFNANGGTCGVASLTYTDGGTPLTLPVPTLDGKVCTGWFTAASGGTKIASAGATYTPTATQTLYAQWTDAPPCFVPGTATLGSGTTATLADGTKVTMESCTVSETNISVGKSLQFEFSFLHVVFLKALGSSPNLCQAATTLSWRRRKAWVPPRGGLLWEPGVDLPQPFFKASPQLGSEDHKRPF